MQPDQRPQRKQTDRARGMPRRPTDRLEDAVSAVLLLVLFVAAIAAMLVGTQTYASVLEMARVQAAARTPVTATLMQDTPSPRTGDLVSAQVHWTGPDGVEHIGATQAHGGLNAGHPVPIWVDRSNNIVPKPVDRTDALVAAVSLGGTLLAIVAGLLALAWNGTRRCTMALNRARWEREWAMVEPAWSAHYR